MTKEQVLGRLRPTERMKAIALHVVRFLLGMLAARAVVFGKCAPFGVALAAACPWNGMAATALGAAVGYLLPGDVQVPMHAVAALGACVAIRWALRGMRRWRNPSAFAAFLAGVPMTATGLCVAVVNGSTAVGTAYYIAEGLLAGAWGYFTSQAESLIERRGRGRILPQELTCAAFAAGPFLLALSMLRIGPISVGGVLAVLIVLYAGKYGGMAGGAVAGVATGACFAFSGTGLSGLMGAYGIGGLMGGLFAPLGRLAGACAFILSSALASLPGSVTTQRLDTLWEVALATVLFLLLPDRLGVRLIRPLAACDTGEAPRARDLRRSVVARLDHAASAMEEVAETVKEVGAKLDKASTPVGPMERKKAENAAQTRKLMVQQFATVGTVLEEMASEFELHEKNDEAAAAEVAKVLYTFALEPIDVGCRINRFDRMTVEALATRGEGVQVNKAELAREVSKACGRTFGLPSISRTPTSWRLVFCERVGCRAVMGCARHNCYNGALCGDSTRCFEDGSGRYIAILSDGMGSGGRAAVDGVMVSDLMARLVQAGVGFDSALQIVNTAMGVKSGDESVATVDIACVDLYTCAVSFLKAGGAMSFVRHGDSVHPVDAPGLPVGILDTASFHRSQEQLTPGDLVLLVSDGALCEGAAWITGLIQDWSDAQTPQELAEAIVAGAVARRSDGHDDDVTVIAIRLAPG